MAARLNNLLLMGCLLFMTLFIGSLMALAPTASAETVESSPTEVELTPEFILRQELLLNKLIVNIHLLQLDFHNKEARESLADSLAQLNLSIPNFPARSKDRETAGLLSSTLALWPVISRHANWMGKLSAQSPPPEATTLLLALSKLDRQLLLLRQKIINEQPHQGNRLKLLEQALLMQRLSREYLSLVILAKKENKTASGRLQLLTLAQHFNQRLTKLSDQYKQHPHAARPIKQAFASWRFIEGSIKQFPQKPIPEMVALYSDRIVNKLTSVSQMF